VTFGDRPEWITLQVDGCEMCRTCIHISHGRLASPAPCTHGLVMWSPFHLKWKVKRGSQILPQCRLLFGYPQQEQEQPHV
jgi:hypothetical protein